MLTVNKLVFFFFPDGSHLKKWFVSDEGSDQNSCTERSWPCKTLQSVLNRCPDGSAIYVISPELNLNDDETCQVKSEKSIRIVVDSHTTWVKMSKR